MKKKQEAIPAADENTMLALPVKRKRKSGKASRVINRIFGFVLATVIMAGIGGLALEWVLVKGPSTTIRDKFCGTMFQTRRFTFIPNIFLTEEEVAEIKGAQKTVPQAVSDASLVTVSAPETTSTENGPQPDAYGLIDEDGDGIVIVDVKKKGFVGKMMVIYDPQRVFVGKPDVYGGYGLSLEDMVKKYDAIGGINGGGFFDSSGGGNGGVPDGLTIIGGEVYNEGVGGDSFAGFDGNGVLHVGYFNLQAAVEAGIRDGVSFGPCLIINGEGQYGSYMESGINPRTAIGQRADGAVLMLVIDGRQVHSIGASWGDARDVMLDFGAVNACNMDGGSSTVMYFNGEYINSCSSASGYSRGLPNGFLVK